MQRSFVRLLQVLITVAALMPGLALAANPIDDSKFFITQIYKDLLNRNPSQYEQNDWYYILYGCYGDTNCLGERRLYIARSVFESSEHYAAQGLNPSSSSFQWAYLTRGYTGFLRRQPDSAGFNYWLSYLQSTNDYNGVIRSFITSSEYRMRFGAP